MTSIYSSRAEDRSETSNQPSRMRSFEEIIADANNNRNILEIHLKKNISDEDPDTKPPNLTHDQLGDLLFDHLNINVDDCIRFNFTGSRYDTREVILKPSVDLSPYITVINDFHGHTVTTRRQSNNVLRVSFRNVPLNVPDEEIIHLSKFYGKPVNNKVHYEKMTNAKCRGMSGSTRYVEMEMNPGSTFLNFYWIEGPLPGDQGSRMTVLHSGQDRQCSHCLQTWAGGCPGQGQGRVCKELGTPRTKMADYMISVKRKIGYESLKSEFTNRFPSLGRKSHPTSAMEEKDDDDNEDSDNSEVSKKTTEVVELEHKLEEKSAEFDEAVEKVSAIELKLIEKSADFDEAVKKASAMEKKFEEKSADLDEAVKKASAMEQKHFQTKRSVDLARNKISTATAGLDMFLKENIKLATFDEFSPEFQFLITQYSSLLITPECYTVNPESSVVTMSKELFINLADSNPKHTEKLLMFKEKLKDKLEYDLSVRKERRNSSISSLPRPRSNSTKRMNEDDNTNKLKQARAQPLTTSGSKKK